MAVNEAMTNSELADLLKAAVDAIAARMAAARTSNWEAAVVRVLWDDLAERVGREEADRKLRVVFVRMLRRRIHTDTDGDRVDGGTMSENDRKTAMLEKGQLSNLELANLADLLKAAVEAACPGTEWLAPDLGYKDIGMPIMSDGIPRNAKQYPMLARDQSGTIVAAMTPMIPFEVLCWPNHRGIWKRMIELIASEWANEVAKPLPPTVVNDTIVWPDPMSWRWITRRLPDGGIEVTGCERQGYYVRPDGSDAKSQPRPTWDRLVASLTDIVHVDEDTVWGLRDGRPSRVLRAGDAVAQDDVAPPAGVRFAELRQQMILTDADGGEWLLGENGSLKSVR